MVAIVTDSAVSLADKKQTMVGHGVNVEALKHTVQVFNEMGKPFTNPACPIWKTPVPAPAPGAALSALCKKGCSVGSTSAVCRIEKGDMVICLAATAGSCTKGQVQCSSSTSLPTPAPGPLCKLNVQVFMTSYGQRQLRDSNGHVDFSLQSEGWEKLTLTDAGDDKVFLTSHRDEQLIDRDGSVETSPNRQGWEKWTLTDAGNGNVYITGHRGEQLSDRDGNSAVTSSKGRSEQFNLKDMNGATVCGT